MAQVTETQLIELFKKGTANAPVNVGLFEGFTGGKTLKDPGEVEGRYQSYAKSLFKKYQPYLGDLPDGWQKYNMAIAMENWSRATKFMENTTEIAAIQPFLKYAFPLIRMILPQLATEKLFNIQMMFGPVSNIYFFEYLYGTTTGKVTAGDTLFDNHDPFYGASRVDLEVNGVGNGTGTVNDTMPGNNKLHVPVLVEGVEITFVSGNQEYKAVTTGTVTGNQAFLGDPPGQSNIVDGASSYVNISTGAWQITLTGNNTFASGKDILFTYFVDNEAPDLNTNPAAIPEIELRMTSKQVQAISRKIRFRWSFESQFALKDQFGLLAETEFLNAAAAEIGYGIDSANVNEVRRNATDVRGNGTYQFPNVPSGVSLQEHVQSLPVYFSKASNRILTDTGRGIGNKIVAGEAVINLVQSIGVPRFVAVPVTPSRGIFKVGDLDNRWEVFWDVRFPRHEYLVIYKSDEFLRAAFVWAPWIVAFTTPTSVLDDFQGRKGVGTLYGKHIVNAKMFVLANVNNAY